MRTTLHEAMRELHDAAEPIRVEVRALRDAVGGWVLRALGVQP